MDNRIFKEKKIFFSLHGKILYEQENISAGCIRRLGSREKQEDLQKNDGTLMLHSITSNQNVQSSEVLCKETR